MPETLCLHRKVPLPLFSLCVVLAVSGEVSAQGPSPSTGPYWLVQSGDSNGGATGGRALNYTASAAIKPGTRITGLCNGHNCYANLYQARCWQTLNNSLHR